MVIDAFNGEVTFYQVDRKDPIASTYGKIYPNLLKDINEMPEGCDPISGTARQCLTYRVRSIEPTM